MAITPQSNATLEQIADVLRKADSVMIAGHVSPDGDCIGSQLALACVLESMGKQVTCLLANEGPIDPTLEYLPRADRMVPASQELSVHDVVIAVDVPNQERMGLSARYHDASPCTVTIDHHANDKRISDYTYVDPDIAATAMIVWDLARMLCDNVPCDVATCCYAGLMTDTGGFRFQNSNRDAFLAASEMVAAGADPAEAATQAYQNISLASMKLEFLAVDHAVFVADGKGVVSWGAEDDMARIGAKKSDLEPLVDTLRSIRGVKVACMLREQDGVVRGSLRAKDSTDVSAIARRHNGGGHIAAAGFTEKLPMDAVVKELASEIEAALS